MAAEELKKEAQGESLELREKEKIENPAELLQSSLGGLDKFGGFQLLKGLIKGIENMDPRRKAIKHLPSGCRICRQPPEAEERTGTLGVHSRIRRHRSNGHHRLLQE